MNKKVIVLVSVDLEDSRGKCEDFENCNFMTQEGIFEAFAELTPTETGKGHPSILIYELTDFMDECNNQEFNAENWFITFVNVPHDAVIR